MQQSEKMLKFTLRTGEVSIDLNKCTAPNCQFVCVKACRFYGRAVLKIERDKPALAISHEEAPRLCNECLACEIHCELHGNNAIKITLPLFGLQEYRKNVSAFV